MRSLSLVLLPIFLFGLIFLAGCSANASMRFQCADGSFVDTAAACSSVQCKTNCPETDCSSCPPKIEYQTKTVEKPVIKYQCADGSTQDNLSDCPQIPEAKKISPVKELSGTGDKVTDPFYLAAGFAKVTGTYKGTSNFIVHLIDEDGNDDYLFNEIGSYTGETAITIGTAGNYRLEVQAQGWNSVGSWTVKFEQ